MDFGKVINQLEALNQPSYRFDQLQKSLIKAQDWDQILGWPETLKSYFVEKAQFSSWRNSSVIEAGDGTKKAILTMEDGKCIETVLMLPKPQHRSICVSCEVGCPMNCSFCATGALGFKRALSATEICDQVLFWTQYLRSEIDNRINSIVFMGMGEPFHNMAAVFQAVEWLHTYYGFGYRHISISTCGIPEGIHRLAISYPQLNLAISLHSTNEIIRTKLMPINKVHNLTDLKRAIDDYLKVTNRQILFEYVLLDGVNNSQADMKDLVDWMRQFPPHLVHINLIRYNATGKAFQSPPIKTVYSCKQHLSSHGISVSIRKNLGDDINGACGQLAAANISP